MEGNKPTTPTSEKTFRLPDIDPSGRDTFETSDSKEDTFKENTETIPEIANENIEKPSLASGEAFKKFADKTWSSAGDYSDSVAKRRIKKGGFVQDQHDYELSETVQNETVLQRFHRLQYEVKNLMSDIEEKKKEKAKEGADHEVDLSSVAEELSVLRRGLDGLLNDDSAKNIVDPQYEIRSASAIQDAYSKKLLAELQRFSNVASPSVAPEQTSTQATYELYFSPEQRKAQQLQRIGDLEARLKTLETFLGTPAVTSSALFATLDQIKEKIGVLSNPSQLEAVQRKVKSVTQELEEVSDRKVAAQTQHQEKKLNEIMEIMNRWDITSQNLPALITRLQSLKTLHDEAAGLLQGVTLLDSHQQEMRKLLKSNADAVKQMDTNFSSNVKVIQSNVTTLENKIAALSKKLEELGIETF
eukprot:TRINITY_DN6701_c0_g1_i1.p1 TRINITY_DN6701_c0_g1~~TRINITY_DN6701_c0_g1_i1.p1  ORF type:complete len:446 (+),score=109.32 TRINITY_DN6701_c0_g1_i1:92-1339(+)